MRIEEIIGQLESIAGAKEFASRSEELIKDWSSKAAGIETVEAILRFMEDHPLIDYGMPGPLVHFVERFYGDGYEAKLVESIQRKPISHTVWMLNRVINGTRTTDVRERLIAVMEQAKHNPDVDAPTLEIIDGFLIRLLH